MSGQQGVGTTISVVMPVFNEAQILVELCEKIDRTLYEHKIEYEIVLVNDGSSDGSGEVLDSLAQGDTRIKVIHLSRNFGHQNAVHAGFVHASGDAILVMDSDMQDDPAGIPMLVDKWREGYDVVYALRVQRKENLVKRMLFSGFYQVLSRLSYVPLPRDAGNFSLVDGKVARGIAGLAEYDRYFPGIRGWIGFQQVGVEIGRLPRYDGKGRVSYRGLYNLAKTAIFSFSSFPLSVFYYITYASLLICGVVIVFTLYHKFVTGLAIPGWTSYVLITSFFGAINSLGIGILGEYIMRIYDQVRGRPNFVIDRKINL